MLRNTKTLQDFNSSVCGYYGLFYLYFRTRAYKPSSDVSPRAINKRMTNTSKHLSNIICHVVEPNPPCATLMIVINAMCQENNVVLIEIKKVEG